jgi:DNA-binding XRE family transcriptional regulator
MVLDRRNAFLIRILIILFLIAEEMRKKPQSSRIPSVLVSVQPTEPVLLKQAQLARALNVSSRLVDYWERSKKIPSLKISPRCVRFSLPAVLRALAKYEIEEVGRRV